MAVAMEDLYQGTTSVVPSGLQSALGTLKTNHFLSAAPPIALDRNRGGSSV